MKKYFTLFIVFLCFIKVYSNPISEREALQIANKFLQNKNINISTLLLSDLIYIEGVERNNPDFYIFSKANEGFIIISAEEFTLPVIAYSEESDFKIKDIPFGLKQMLFEYSRYIQAVRNADIVMSLEIESAKAQQLASTSKLTCSVEPLLNEIKWQQSNNYNALCPMDWIAEKRCPVGCVATAMAQIMRYWQHPSFGQGNNSYSIYKFRTISADFNCFYDWNKMPKDYAMPESALLSYHCAVSADMTFTAYGSGASTTIAGEALYKYFDYKMPYSIERSNYTTEEWVSMLYNEIDNDRPVIYSGASMPDGGHAYICDGYDSNGLFHINWGWGGKYNGYFSIDELKPGGLNFNFIQTAVRNIEPQNKYCNKPQNIISKIEDDKVILTWEKPEENLPIYYDIYENDKLIANEVIQNTYTIENVSQGEHIYAISAVYPECTSAKLGIRIYVSDNIYQPVEALYASVAGNDVSLLWSVMPYNDKNDQAPTSYTIYRDGLKIEDDFQELNYADKDLEIGIHDYCIEVNYNDNKSDLICVQINIVDDICYPISDLTSKTEGKILKLLWSEPETSKELKYDVYRNGNLIETDICTNYCELENQPEGKHRYCVIAIDGTCMTSPECIDVEYIAIEEETEFQIYPNPVSSNIYIQGVEVVDVFLYNITGQIVGVYHDNIINVSELSQGIYFLHIIDDEGNIFIEKILKE